MVMWYWSADTLFWQLSIDHDMEVQYQRFSSNQSGNCSVTPLPLPQNLYGRTDGRTVTWLPNFLGLVVYQIFLPMVLRWRASRAGAPLRMRESPGKTTWLVNLFCFDSLCIHSTVLKILCGKAETKQQISRYLLNNANQVFSIVCESSEYSNWGAVEHK